MTSILHEPAPTLDRATVPSGDPDPWLVWRDAVVLATALALGMQAIHATEHGIQAGYWLTHPSEAPFLTAWATAGRDALAALTAGSTLVGSEVLHLLGNVLFLAGLVGLRTIDAADARTGHRVVPAARRRRTRRATIAQSVHVAEHVLLTATAAASGTARGVSTMFGALDAGDPGAVAFRVWLHFVLNLVPTLLTVAALRTGRRTGRPADRARTGGAGSARVPRTSGRR